MLLHIEKRVDPKFELSAVVKAVENLDKVIIFHNLKRSEFDVAANIVVSKKMFSLLLNTSEADTVQEYVRRAEKLIKPTMVSTGPAKDHISR